MAALLAVLTTGFVAGVGQAAGDAGLSASTQAPPARFRTLPLDVPIHRVNDGDTFEADLDGDGELQFPRERVRLLFVDTPELGESRKGRDLRHGLPAKAALESLLSARPLVLHIQRETPFGNYGRTLALVQAGGVWISRELIRQGHTPLDTRFSFPPDYPGYLAAEAEAFDARRGIWSDEASRRRYLKRLRREGRTPASLTNALYDPEVLEAAHFDPQAKLGRYVRLNGMLADRRVGSKGVVLLKLELGPGRGHFSVVVFRRRAALLNVGTWVRGRRVRVEGFVKRYRGHLELVVHRGLLLPP